MSDQKSGFRGPPPGKRWSYQDDSIDGREADYDIHPTPPEYTMALLDSVKLEGVIWEPAVGDGAIATVIREYYPNNPIICTDIVHQGFAPTVIADFLRTTHKVQCIVTNPPFNKAMDFVIHSLIMAELLVCMLLKNEFAGGVDKWDRLLQYRKPDLQIKFPRQMRNRYTGKFYTFYHSWWVWSTADRPQESWDLTFENDDWTKAIWCDNTRNGPYWEPKRSRLLGSKEE